MSLAGKVAVVTGGGRGIGRGIAIALAKYGAKVVVTARSADEIDAVANEIKANGGTAIALTGDVSNWEDVLRVKSAVTSELGEIAILINNAGILGQIMNFEATDPEQWAKTIDINLTGAYYWTRAVINDMLDAGWGRIINISSGAAQGTGITHLGAYSASKTGMDMFTKSLASEVGERGVWVNSVYPGVVESEMQRTLRTSTDNAVSPRFKQLHDDGILTDALDVGEQVTAVVMSEYNGEILDVRTHAEALQAILKQI